MQMRSAYALIAVVLWVNAVSLRAHAAEQSTKCQTIDFSAIEEMFAAMRVNSGWDMSQPLLWGYFFINDSKKPLVALSASLTKDRYRRVRLWKQGQWRLHMEKIEIHDELSLFARNSTLSEMAAQHDVACYDGMDVGLPVPATPSD